MTKKTPYLKYKSELSRYTRKDTITAVYFFAFYIAVSVVLGIIAGLMEAYGPLIISICFGLFILAACIILVVKKGDSITSIGFRRNNLRLSLVVGIICGFSVILANGLVLAIIYGWPLASAGAIISTFVYQVFVISFAEEVVFRGYIQTRLYGIFKKDAQAVTMGALLFALMHIPFRLLAGNLVFDINFVIWIATTFVWHYIFNFIYRKTNSIYGVVLFHALANTSGSIFIRDFTNVPMWAGNFIFFYLGAWVVLLGCLGVRAVYMRQRA